MRMHSLVSGCFAAAALINSGPAVAAEIGAIDARVFATEQAEGRPLLVDDG